MICRNCGTENIDARFCKECGAPLLFICTNCGAGNSEGKFCKECGTKLLSEVDNLEAQSFENISQEASQNITLKENAAENSMSETPKPLSILKFKLFEKKLEYSESVMMFGDFMRTSIGFRVFISTQHDKFINNERKLDSYLHNLPAFLNTVVTTALTTVEEMISKYYDFSKLSIPKILSCYQEYFDYTTYIAPVLSEYQRLCGCEINIDNYYNTPSSGGKWVGGGFGFGGALKGALTAGALNIGSGLINGIGNYISKGVELSRLDSEKEKLHSICKSYVNNYLKELSSNCLFVTEEILTNYTNYEKFSPDYDEADDIFNSIDESSIDDSKEKITRCLVLYPFRSDFYEFIVDHYETAGNDLEKIAETFLGDNTIQEYKLDIEENIYNLIKEEGLDKCKAKWDKNAYANNIISKIENEAKNNILKAKVVFQNALNGGDISAVKNTILYTEIIRELITDTELLCAIGKIYEDGCYGVEKDIEKSIVYYELAAKLEDIEAMERLSLLYYLSKNDVTAELWARKVLSLNNDSIQAKKILGLILDKKYKSIDECKEAIELYTYLSGKQYSDLEDVHTPAYFCHCAAEVYENNVQAVRNKNKAIEWYLKGAKLALEHPEDSWGETCCVAAISKLMEEGRYDEMVTIALGYKNRCFYADYTLGYAYCRGLSVIKDYNIGAKYFLSVINNYDVSKNINEYQKAYYNLKKSAQEALDKMICKNGVWKKKMFENI